eukprot:354200-Amphidinium_carterae.2
MLLRVEFEEGAEEHAQDKETAKVWVVELCYGLLLRKLSVDPEQPAAFIYVQVPMSVQLKASDRGTGESVRNVLLATSHIEGLDLDKLTQTFTHVLRLSETDECGANIRGERLLSSARQHTFKLLHTLCSAHKVHAAARKPMSLLMFTPLVSGMINTLKVLWERKHLQTFHKSLLADISTRLRYTRCDSLPNVTRGAAEFKADVVRLFCPSSKRPRVRARVRYLQEMMNGDWRQVSHIDHYCVGSCCHDRDDCVRKVQKHILRVAKQLRAYMVCRDNWGAWPEHLHLFGVLGLLHGILRNALSRVLVVPTPAQPAPMEQVADPATEVLDQFEAQRRERAQCLRASSDWLASDWEKSLWLFRQSLDPQVHLMAALLHHDSEEHAVSDLHSWLTSGKRCYNILHLHDGTDTNQMLHYAMLGVQANKLGHGFLAETEEVRTKVLISFMKPAAIVWQLVVLRLNAMPYKLFELLSEPTITKATELLATPQCMQDPVCAHMFQTYTTPEQLISQHCLQTLAGAAAFIRGTTFSTERKHANNRRRAFGRVHTHVMDLATVGLPHAAGATCRYIPVESSSAQTNKRKAVKSPKTQCKRRKWSAWNAFLARKARDGQPCLEQKFAGLKDLQARFHALSAEERMAYQGYANAGLCTSKPVNP